MQVITVQKRDNVLHLSGVLDCDTLNELWHNRTELLKDIKGIGVSALIRVDSAGLALLTYFCIKQNVKLLEINQQLKTLIILYDLDTLLV